ncbi:tetratricopeptide repeat-containing sensor histidine kinase [Tenacibaculum amylolyticum]|uniref:tetratricopeptide repeat-containing sensor histidine kinase n=1 Tax=Tenacibaculum amylolyticum TaxID=104269 RepID=UPI0038956523
MKKNIILIISIICFKSIVYGQYDEFKEIIENTDAYKEKVTKINELAWKNRKEYSIGIFYAQEAKKISDSLGYDEGISTSLTRLGVIEKIRGNNLKAIEHYKGSLKIEEKLKNFYGISRAKIQIGRIYQKEKEYEKALEYSKEALIAAEKQSNKKLLATVYYTIATIYYSIENFEKSLANYFLSLEIRKKVDDTKGLARDYLDIGNIYNKTFKYNKAFVYLKKSLSLYKKNNNERGLSKVYNGLGINYYKKEELDSALFYYSKSLAIKNELKDLDKADIMNNIGLLYKEKELFDLAINYFRQSIEISEGNKKDYQLINSYYNLGELYRKKKDYKNAIQFLNKSLKLTNKYNEKYTKLQLLMSLAETYENLKEYEKASFFNESHIVLRDSIDATYRALEAFESKYEREKQKNQLLVKEKEIDKEKNLRIVAENRKKTIQLYALTGGIALIALLFFALFFAYKSKKAKELAEKTKEIEVQRNIELLKKQELKSIKAMINGQESERKRIAQDLHDRLGSMLSMVKLNYKSIEDNIDKLKEENKKQYSQANALLDEACNAVREIAHNMVSGVLTKFGLVAALEDLKNTIKGTNTFQLELITHGLDDRLENNLEMELYGIVQELIHNVIKHAKASEVSVQLLKRSDSLNLTVIDDGVGFDNSIEVTESGMGLKGVASRVNALNGTIDIDTGRGNGTTINIEVPI